MQLSLAANVTVTSSYLFCSVVILHFLSAFVPSGFLVLSISLR